MGNFVKDFVILNRNVSCLLTVKSFDYYINIDML